MDNVALLLLREFREHGQREHFMAGLLAFRKIALFVTQVAEAWLKMKGQRVINLGTYSPLGKISPQCITFPIKNTGRILMENVLTVFRAVRGFYVLKATEELIVA